jgi:hypothetical protein
LRVVREKVVVLDIVERVRCICFGRDDGVDG